MATLIFTAVGTAIGGPLGGAIGSLIGNQLDRAIIGGGKREGPRLKELAVSTSSYGTPIPRQFGTMRAPGSIIWSTDLVESGEKTGGGKGAPSTVTYSYSVSLAVALSSRPISRLGRIWADGNLLRGAGGDLKTAGELRLYSGHGDQQPDPLIAADRGAMCPAFRGIAYCVFESLQLADFGNRIPALTFEIVADDGQVTLLDLLEPLDEALAVDRPLPGLGGFDDEGGALSSTLAAIDQLYPLACDAGGQWLSITATDAVAAAPQMLPEAVVDPSGDSFGAASGHARRRQADTAVIPDSVRYYDTGRDYQAGVQRADGRARTGRSAGIEFPGALDAGTARNLINAAAARAGWLRETLAWRTAELDPAIAPGQMVQVPDQPGLWRIDSWEWRDTGIELELSRLPPTASRVTVADPGESLPKPDLTITPTTLVAFELPWDGQGTGDTRQAYAAASSTSAGWKGAALYLEQASGLVPLGGSGSGRSVVGVTASAVSPSASLLLEREATIDVDLLSADFELASVTPDALAQGANRAVLGDEIVQFACASRISGRRWRLQGLLRGRGGTEPAALAGHAEAAPFVLLDGTPVSLDPAVLGRLGAATLAAIGLADADPATSPLINAGSTTRPLAPVWPRLEQAADGTVNMSWVRRARGAWTWADGVDVPLVEQSEQYLVGIGDSEAPGTFWQLSEPKLELTASAFSDLLSAHSGQPIWVRQVGSFAMSPALLLTTLS